MREHDFTDAVAREIGQAAMFVCQNPDCLCFTGFNTAEGRPRRVAEAAHVLPSGKAGPRSKQVTQYPSLNLASSANGLWLCKNCHSLVDGDATRFPPRTLFQWKNRHQDLMRGIVGKDIEAALLNLGNAKRYHQEIRDLLSFFGNRRVLYEGMDAESPPRVIESLDMIRQRLVQSRAAINPDTDLFPIVGTLQDAISRFLRAVGPDTNLRELRCDSGDPKWQKFAEELTKFRAEVIVVLRILAWRTGYPLTNF